MKTIILALSILLGCATDKQIRKRRESRLLRKKLQKAREAQQEEISTLIKNCQERMLTNTIIAKK